MKVYLFYLISEREVYSYTIDKYFRDMFKEQRNMSLFKVITKEINKYEFMMFSNENKDIQLAKDILTDDHGNDIEIICTPNESSLLNDTCDYIFTTIDSMSKYTHLIPAKKKYLKVITELTGSITNPTSNTLNINTFKVFYTLFKNTFEEDSNGNHSLISLYHSINDEED